MVCRSCIDYSAVAGYVSQNKYGPLTAGADYIFFFSFFLSGQPAFERVKENNETKISNI